MNYDFYAVIDGYPIILDASGGGGEAIARVPAEMVRLFLANEYKSYHGLRPIIYRDEFGYFDALFHRHGEYTHTAVLGVASPREAVMMLKRMAMGLDEPE